MPQYRIEHRIATLATIAILDDDATTKYDEFTMGGIYFAPWNQAVSGGGRDFWIAETTVQATDYVQAFHVGWRPLQRIGSRLALVTQTYLDVVLESYLIAKDGAEEGFFRFVTDGPAVGLMLRENGLAALRLLLTDASAPEEFYYYWHDAVNAVGYAAKILLMLSGVEAWARARAKALGRSESEWWMSRREILGADLDAELFEQVQPQASARPWTVFWPATRWEKLRGTDS